MIVVGGYYIERTLVPDDCVGFGSGGRAAIAIAQAGTDVTWHTYLPDEEIKNLRRMFGRFPIDVLSNPTPEIIEFTYFHALSKPVVTPWPVPINAPMRVRGDVVLRFGFMEGDAVIDADVAVYDPQSPNAPAGFGVNGSTAGRLAVVVNAREVLRLGEAQSESDAVRNINVESHAEIILVKAGAAGCRVYQNSTLVGSVPAFRTDSIQKIGSGDMFSAAFAYHWASQGTDPLKAAELASRCTARYCATGTPSVLTDEFTDNLMPAVRRQDGKVYLAGPFFTLGERWLVEETLSALTELGANVFSPFHEIGVGEADKVAPADIQALESCTAMIALIDSCDPGTIYEIGFARSIGLPVVVLSQNPKSTDLTMLKGTGCVVTNDFSSAIYQAAWSSWQ